MTLTTTQHSAFGDLDRFGELTVSQGNAQHSRGTKYGYGAKTLAALVEAGHAEWITTRPDSEYLAYPRTIVKPGENLVRHAATARMKRVREAEGYVASRFFPPLPSEYGEIAVKALEVHAESGWLGIIVLPDGLNPKPRGAGWDPEREAWTVTCREVIDILRIGHLIDDFDEWED